MPLFTFLWIACCLFILFCVLNFSLSTSWIGWFDCLYYYYCNVLLVLAFALYFSLFSSFLALSHAPCSPCSPPLSFLFTRFPSLLFWGRDDTFAEILPKILKKTICTKCSDVVNSHLLSSDLQPIHRSLLFFAYYGRPTYCGLDHVQACNFSKNRGIQYFVYAFSK